MLEKNPILNDIYDIIVIKRCLMPLKGSNYEN